MHDVNDKALARRVQRGDRDALDQLVERYLRPIHSVVASYMSQAADVDDVVQETFMRAIAGISSYSASRPFAPWLYEVARNTAKRRLTSGVRHQTELLSGDEPHNLDAGPDDHAQRSEIRRHVDAAMADLPEQQRTAFRLHDVDGFTTAEVAVLMGLTTGTVRSHVHYARRTLRAALAPIFDEQKDGILK